MGERKDGTLAFPGSDPSPELGPKEGPVADPRTAPEGAANSPTRDGHFDTPCIA